jgi:hypothetical protein
MEPRFTNAELWRVALACVGFVALAIAGLMATGNMFNISTAAGGTGAVANSVGVWMALVGVVVVGFGLFYTASELTVPTKTPTDRIEIDSVPPGVVKEIAEALKSLKGAAAVLFVGVILVAMSGGVTWQTAESGNAGATSRTDPTRDTTGRTRP